MTEEIIALARSYYQIEPTPLIPNQPVCRDDGYCDFNVGVFRLQVYGRGLAVVEARTFDALFQSVDKIWTSSGQMSAETYSRLPHMLQIKWTML